MSGISSKLPRNHGRTKSDRRIQFRSHEKAKEARSLASLDLTSAAAAKLSSSSSGFVPPSQSTSVNLGVLFERFENTRVPTAVSVQGGFHATNVSAGLHLPAGTGPGGVSPLRARMRVHPLEGTRSASVSVEDGDIVDEGDLVGRATPQHSRSRAGSASGAASVSIARGGPGGSVAGTAAAAGAGVKSSLAKGDERDGGAGKSVAFAEPRLSTGTGTSKGAKLSAIAASAGSSTDVMRSKSLRDDISDDEGDLESPAAPAESRWATAPGIRGIVKMFSKVRTKTAAWKERRRQARAAKTGVNASNALNISGIESEELKMLLRGLGLSNRELRSLRDMYEDHSGVRLEVRGKTATGADNIVAATGMTPGDILNWCGEPCTPFLEYLLLRLLRYTMRIPTPQLLRVPKPELRKSVGKPGFVSVRKHPLVTMSFEQFLHLLLVYCTFTGPDVTKFLFDILDDNGDDGLDSIEVEYMMRMLNEGNALFREATAKNVLQMFDKAFKLQDAMRKASLGVVAWQLAMERRDDFEKKLAEAGSSVSPDATAAAAAGAGAGVSSATGPTSAAPAGVDLSASMLTGAIPDFSANKLNVSHNLLTGNATLQVEVYGDEPFQYNCFDPAVPPSNPSC